jgi:hypothetical protein
MSWTATVRTWWDELFKSDYTSHLLEEVSYLKNQLEQARIDNAKLQLMLNTVTPAGFLANRAANPPKRPEYTGPPPIKRWAAIEAERYALLDKKAEEARKALAEKESKAA